MHRRHRGPARQHIDAAAACERTAADEKGQRLDEPFTCAANKALGAARRFMQLGSECAFVLRGGAVDRELRVEGGRPDHRRCDQLWPMSASR
ncbi:hypothetical protein MTO96_021405 [Rhipicephalus appendiculatus]